MITRVLYVDDEPDIREIATMSLEIDPNFEVRSAASGDAALELLGSGEWIPDVLLFDLMMPGLDGQALLKAVRQLPRYVQTPIIFVTARTQSADIGRLLELGAHGVITKPFDPMILAREVRDKLGET
jgi:two-component system OmpR family response regulator